MATDYLGGVVRDTFTVAGNGTAQLNIGKPKTKFTLKVIGTGATPTAWSVVLEGSLDDADSAMLAIKGTEGKRLTYKIPMGLV